MLLYAPAFPFKVRHSHPASIIATNMVSPVSNKYLIALIIELKAPKGKTMYSCYSRVNFYLCLSWHSSLFRVESQSCSLWLLPKEGKKRANNMASWGKKIKKKRFKGNGRCSRVSPGTRRNYRHREVSVSIKSCVSVK